MILRGLRGLRVYLIMVVAGRHWSSAISRDTVLLRSASFADFAPSREANKGGTAIESRDGLVINLRGKADREVSPSLRLPQNGGSREGAKPRSQASVLVVKATNP
jgi:hypothetical protein